MEIKLKRQQVNLTADKNSVVFTSTDLEEEFEFEYEWDDIFYAMKKEYENDLSIGSVSNGTIPINVNGVEYVRKDSIGENKMAEKLDGMDYVIVRTYSAGVFAGYLKSRNGQEVVMKRARRIWYWDGAASLSQLAVDGTSKPENCQFPCEVDEIELLQAVEIIKCSDKAKKSIWSVKEWKK